MKITPKEYATGLFYSISGKNDDEIKNIVNNFVNLLIINNDVSKADKVSQVFSSLWNKENKIVESEVTTSNKLDAESQESLKKFLIKESKAKEVIIKENIDKSILGGMIIKYNDKILDRSLKTKIKNLNNFIKR
ncbi:MAG: ATP synthase F1 subunit delta [Parcubacteria group bacterium CG10_big_fil_rev_8_21_14_0_10_38_31]|nr:MAG: ATP synthase F1 subunit delta [Parcubacteria group bacterium CG10_big_fil_rev_8_21_14_0_10_38_31]